MPRRGLLEWLTDRWLARRFDHERGYDQPLWWRAREMRRLSVGAPIITRYAKRTRVIPPSETTARARLALVEAYLDGWEDEGWVADLRAIVGADQ